MKAVTTEDILALAGISPTKFPSYVETDMEIGEIFIGIVRGSKIAQDECYAKTHIPYVAQAIQNFATEGYVICPPHPKLTDILNQALYEYKTSYYTKAEAAVEGKIAEEKIDYAHFYEVAKELVQSHIDAARPNISVEELRKEYSDHNSKNKFPLPPLSDKE